MVNDPLLGWGLNPVALADRPLLETYFSTLRHPLSDYTFSQLFTWQNSLRIAWKEIDGHLCVFANGCGDLTLLVPPIGDTGGDRALARATELMDAYNAAHGVPDHTRVEYVSDELLARFDHAKLNVEPLGHDYVYDVNRMIDLAGGDLASKRQAKNRFARNYEYRVEPYSPGRHREHCRRLLDQWRHHQDAAHDGDVTADTSKVKRLKESAAVDLCLEVFDFLPNRGMVVYVKERPEKAAELAAAREGAPDPGAGLPCDGDGFKLRGFTFGEYLGADHSSITIEKTDLAVKGLAQFIFSEFCRTAWADRPFVNVGDDWGLESLAWTKTSYRPVNLLKKYVMRPKAVASILVRPQPAGDATPIPMPVAAVAAAVESSADETPVVVPAAAVPVAPIPAVPLPPAAAIPAASEGSTAPSSSRPPRQEAPPLMDATPAPVRIRPADAKDLPAAAELENDCFGPEVSISSRQLRYLQQRGSAVFLVAEQGDRVVGDGIALVRSHPAGKPSGRIYSLAVRAEARGQRIGERLLSAMIDALADRGVGRVYLEVEAGNANAVRLYARLGFRTVGTLPEYYGDGRDGLHMMLDDARSAPSRAVG